MASSDEYEASIGMAKLSLWIHNSIPLRIRWTSGFRTQTQAVYFLKVAEVFSIVQVEAEPEKQ